jgi:tRNA(Ile)-lysidine synthase
VGDRSTLPGGIELEVEYDSLLLRNPRLEQVVDVPQVREGEIFGLPVPGSVVLQAGWRLTADNCSITQFQAQREAGGGWQAFVDADLAGALLVRTRRRGERMQPFGMGGRHAKVSDIMINEKLPAAWRARWPVVANDSHPVWLVGIRLDERVRVHKRTQRVIQLRCEQPNA